MTEGVLTRVVGCKRSCDVWKRINEYFTAHTRAKVHQYRSELRNTKKGTRSMAKYLLRIKELVDALISIGSEVTESEHVEIVLEGLSNEYDAFSTAIRTKKEPYTVSEIESLLLAQETRTDSVKQISSKMPSSNFSANLTALPKDKNDSIEKSSYQASSRGSFQNFRGGRRGSHRSRGRGRFYSNYQGGRGSIVCQVCHKVGHSALECYHRFNHNNQSQPPQLQSPH